MEKIPGVTEIGPWSEIKLQIVKNYAAAFSTILAKHPLRYDYIDAFAGAGIHVSRATKEPVLGSPLNALFVEPPFHNLHLIDLDGTKTEVLRELTAGHENVHIYDGDANKILLTQILPTIRYEEFRRALCLLDPYGMDLKWDVLKMAADLGTIEIFLNYPTMDMNRNSMLKNFELVDARDNKRMDDFWGDDSWKQAAYTESAQASLFGETTFEKEPNEVIAQKFRDRLRDVAGFKFVAEPLPMKNSTGAVLYYLFFASHHQTGHKIATHIFNKYR